MRSLVFLAALSACLSLVVKVSGSDEEDTGKHPVCRPCEHLQAPKFELPDFDKMFGGLKDAFNMDDGDGGNKFANLFGDLSEFQKVFEKGEGDGKGIKGLDLSKLFDGLKDKNKTAEKGKKKDVEMLGECPVENNGNFGGAPCRTDEGEKICKCPQETSFCASPFSKVNSNRNSCVLRAGESCIFGGPSGEKNEKLCASDFCPENNGRLCKQGEYRTACGSVADCSDKDGPVDCGIDGVCCIPVSKTCDASKGSSASRNCCGNKQPGNSQINCVTPAENQTPDASGICSDCRETSENCLRTSECCQFLDRKRPEGSVCIGEETGTGVRGKCGSCLSLGFKGCSPGSLETDCCKNPNDPEQGLKCKGAPQACCIGMQDTCSPPGEQGGCCPGTKCKQGTERAKCKSLGQDRRRLSGSGPVGVEAAASAGGLFDFGVPLTLQNRTNPHGSGAKREALGRAKEKRERKGLRRVPLKAAWLDHYFGYSLAFSDDCSLLAVGEPGTDEQQGAVSVYRLSNIEGQPSEQEGGESNPAPQLSFTFAMPPKRRLVTRPDPPLAGSRLSWTANPSTDRVSLSTDRFFFSNAVSDADGEENPDPEEEKEEETQPHIEVHHETVTVDLAPPRRRFRPVSRDRGGKALFGTAVSQCSVPISPDSDEYVHFLAVSAPGSWHGNVYIYALTQAETGGSVTGRVGDDLKFGFGYEMVQELVSQGGKGPFDFLQRLTLRDAGGFGEARLGQTVQFETRETEERETVLRTTEQREGAQAYRFRMDTADEHQWPPFVRMGTRGEESSSVLVA
uniref:Dickkopf N-terminal cysteine-rich domain-containing protein n=1 Tax=Chromera velia CCMP2878 TaxID=1169474 RepID=A0A0G4H869_9ALVE|eukprot:Cvel_5864.t1-p1 / transcript=Cvel_5864.t1 / gene=Cvel_5864 / organism=Chromera_velia_CCMP2878 / gene_product=hypothetical protein / transcript_product=hypothetical protein / location=Cvel_scaffold279:8390-12608(+) / protein_length=793 / sequence_SO=supercontig / SO=protein_coding / is_pseudo=false